MSLQFRSDILKYGLEPAIKRSREVFESQDVSDSEAQHDSELDSDCEEILDGDFNEVDYVEEVEGNGIVFNLFLEMHSNCLL